MVLGAVWTEVLNQRTADEGERYGGLDGLCFGKGMVGNGNEFRERGLICPVVLIR